MENILMIIMDFLPGVMQAIGALVIAATVIAQMTKSPKDNEAVNKIAKYYFKLIDFLPKFGINPSTDKLKEAYDDLKSRKK